MSPDSVAGGRGVCWASLSSYRKVLFHVWRSFLTFAKVIFRSMDSEVKLCYHLREIYFILRNEGSKTPDCYLCFSANAAGRFFFTYWAWSTRSWLVFFFFSKEMLRANVLTVSHTVNPINFKVILKTQEYIYDLCKNEGKNIKYITVKAFILKGIIML